MSPHRQSVLVVLLGLFLSCSSASAQALGDLFGNKTSDAPVALDEVLQRATRAFRSVVERRAGFERGEARDPERARLAENAVVEFTTKARELLTELELDGLLTQDEASVGLDEASADALVAFDDTLAAIDSGHAPRPHSPDAPWWTRMAELAAYTLTERNETTDWIRLLAWIGGGAVIGLGLAFVIGRTLSRNRGRAMQELSASIRGPLVVSIVVSSTTMAIGEIWLPAAVEDICRVAFQVVLALALLWFLWKLSSFASIIAARVARRTMGGVNEELMEVAGKGFRLFALFIFAFVLAEVFFEVDFTAFVAGLGILGVLLTLALRDVIHNLVASFTIHTAQPFRIGDLIQFRGWIGHIESVGFRCTSLRTLDGHVVTLPNSAMVDEPVENVDARPFIRRRFRIDITYGSRAKGAEEALRIVKDILESRDWHEDHPPRVELEELGEYSLKILIQYHFARNDYWEAKSRNTEINLALLRRLEEAGLGIAFPTQTIEMTRIGGESAFVEDDEGARAARPRGNAMNVVEVAEDHVESRA